MAKGKRKQLQATRKSSVGRPSYLIVANASGAAGNVLGGVRRPKR
jgi:hypothetical protein